MGLRARRCDVHDVGVGREPLRRPGERVEPRDDSPLGVRVRAGAAGDGQRETNEREGTHHNQTVARC